MKLEFYMLYMTIKKDFYDLNKSKSKDIIHSKVVGREVLYRNIYNKKYSSMGIGIKTRLKGIKVEKIAVSTNIFTNI